MKKLFVLSFTVLIAFSVFAQEDSKTKFGIKAGVAFPTVSFSENSSGVKATTSFFVGGTVDVPISPVLSIQPGISLIGTGYKISNDFGSGKKNVMYIQVPVNAVANFDAGPGKVFFGGGPYFGYAISGKTKATLTGQPSTEAKVKIGSSEDSDQKGTDFGINFLAGYQLSNGININAGYGLGLTNLNPKQGNQKEKNRVFTLGLGYSF